MVFRSSDLWRPTGRATVAEGRSTGTSAWRLNEEREDKKEKDNLVQKKASLLIWPRLKRSGLSASELGELCARMGIAMTMGRGCIIDFSLACVNSRVCRWSVFFFWLFLYFSMTDASHWTRYEAPGVGGNWLLAAVVSYNCKEIVIPIW